MDKNVAGMDLDLDHPSEHSGYEGEEGGVPPSSPNAAPGGPKKSSTVFYAICGVCAVGALMLGVRIFSSMSQVHQNVGSAPRASMLAPEDRPRPVAAPVSAPVVSANPATMSSPVTLASEAAARVDVAPGLPNVPASGVAAMSSSAPMASLSSGNDLMGTTPASTMASPTPATLTPVSMAPSGPMSTATPAASPAPNLSGALQGSTGQVAGPAEPRSVASESSDVAQTMSRVATQMNDVQATLKTLVDNTTNMADGLKKTDARVDDLTSRVEKLEARPTTSDGKAAPAEGAHVKHKIVRRHDAKHRVAHETNHVEESGASHGNVVEVLDGAAPSVGMTNASNGATSDQGALFHKAPSSGSVTTAPTYTMKAIVSGRIWVQSSDGTYSTYGVGDELPNGHKVGRIDPEKGAFDTSGNVWPN